MSGYFFDFACHNAGMVLKCFCENLKDLVAEYSISTRLSSSLFFGAPFAALAAISSRARSR